jgi:hypothetical protein
MATRPDDSKSYYGYLYKDDKTPTKVLEALLTAIAQYIVRLVTSFTARCRVRCADETIPSVQIEEIGDKNDKSLTPSKLAAFYKAVGGNYDGK